MNIQEAVTVYLSDDSYENICNDTFNVKLICDRNTKRVYTISGQQFESNIEHMMSDDWYVIRNQ
jgi:hypothetical protein